MESKRYICDYCKQSVSKTNFFLKHRNAECSKRTFLSQSININDKYHHPHTPVVILTKPTHVVEEATTVTSVSVPVSCQDPDSSGIEGIVCSLFF